MDGKPDAASDVDIAGDQYRQRERVIEFHQPSGRIEKFLADALSALSLERIVVT
jgi:hypothetical protein